MKSNTGRSVLSIFCLDNLKLRSMSHLRSAKYAIMFIALTFMIFFFVEILIQLQDYALLLGSIGLFIAMGLIMYTSRNVDWYSANSLKNQDKNIRF